MMRLGPANGDISRISVPLKLVTRNKEFISIKRERRHVGRCLHCKRPATTTAVRKAVGHRMEVRYCDTHDKIIIQGEPI